MNKAVDREKEIRPFDMAIQELGHIRVYLGCELERIEQSLKETKIARLKRIKQLEKEAKTNGL